jgi:indolepyruvate ferredoxin oxidoreductase, beta subunit
MQTKSILISGVGGQGIILASEVISYALFQSGFDVKKNEIHGMSQRGGSVISFIRYGDKVYSPVISKGEADYLMSFEKLEALRNLVYLKKDGNAIVSDIEIEPVPVMLGKMKYPQDFDTTFAKQTKNIDLLPAIDTAREIGNLKVVNIFLIGALSKSITEVKEEMWIDAIKKMVKPSFVDINLKAFAMGRAN